MLKDAYIILNFAGCRNAAAFTLGGVCVKAISTATLRELEVINLCGGERLGYPCDFEIDIDDGRIISLIVSCCEGSIFGKREERTVPWCKIECIGEDAILVKLSHDDIAGGCCAPRVGKKRGIFR